MLKFVPAAILGNSARPSTRRSPPPAATNALPSKTCGGYIFNPLNDIAPARRLLLIAAPNPIVGFPQPAEYSQHGLNRYP